MNRKTGFTAFFVCILAAMLLCGCGSEPQTAGFSVLPPADVEFAAAKVPPETADLVITLEPGETELLSALPELKSADFSGSVCVEEIAAWAEAHPDVKVRYTVVMPDGSIFDNSVKSIDLSDKSDPEIRAMTEQLRLLPGIDSIELGHERSGLSWDLIGTLEELFPEAKIRYIFDLYGQETELCSTQINLSHVPLEDGGAAVERVMDYMPDLCYVDMDSCGVPDEDMARIRDAHPDVKVVWRVWFGDNYSVRTDVERILASSPSKGGMLTPDNTKSLQYCTDVRFLDIGHNDYLTDISFVACMPKLEVAILAMDFWKDASPLANCTELEYLEMQTTSCTDLTPLSGLTKLRHLDIAYNRDLADISPLFGLTELERLWIGCTTSVPMEQVYEMQQHAPNCEINTEVGEDPTGGRWRYVDYNELAYMYIYHPRYIQLREQFDDYAPTAYSFIWNDPLY